MSSIRELVWNLKGAFLDEEFQEAEKALVTREKKLRETCKALETELNQKIKECATKDEKLKDMQKDIDLLKVLKDEAVRRYGESRKKEKEMKEERKEIEREKEELERVRKEVSLGEIEKVRREKGVLEMENRELKKQREELRKENEEMGVKLEGVKEQIERVELEVVSWLYTSLGKDGGFFKTQVGKVVDCVVKALECEENCRGGGGDDKDANFEEDAVLSNNDNPKRCLESGMDFDDVSRTLVFEKEPSPEDITGPPNVISLDSESDDDSPHSPHKRKQPSPNSEMEMNDEDNSDDLSTIKQKVRKLDSLLLESVPALSGSRSGQKIDCREGQAEAVVTVKNWGENLGDISKTATPQVSLKPVEGQDYTGSTLGTISYTPRAIELLKACRTRRAMKTLVSGKDPQDP